MALPARVNLITLGVDDVARATAFYERLGFALACEASTAQVSFFELDNIVLALFARADLADDAAIGDDGGRFKAVALAINLAGRVEVDRAMAAAEAAGAAIVRPPREADWGGYSGYFADPDGNLWELAWNPYLPLDEEGRMVLAPLPGGPAHG